MSGQKIIDGLKDAIKGDFTRVTIEGQLWVRVDARAIDKITDPVCIPLAQHEAYKMVAEALDQCIDDFGPDKYVCEATKEKAIIALAALEAAERVREEK